MFAVFSTESDRFAGMQTEVIAEIGNTHEGSLGIAKSLIDMAAVAGADTVKFQMHLSEYESSEFDEFRIKFSDQDRSRSDYWNRVAFSPTEWALLSEYCELKEIEFLCTPFSVEAAQILLKSTGIRRWKVGSGDAVNFPLIDFLIETGYPLIISTGLISWEELLLLKERLVRKGAWSRTTLMHCVSEYPTPLSRSALNMIQELKELGCEVGLSDHSGELAPSLIGIASGISILEVHLTPHELFFGPDVSSSLNPEQLKIITDFSRNAYILKQNPRSRNELFGDVERTRKLFRKGLYWRSNLDEGTFVQLSDLIFLKPSMEIDAIEYESVIGRQLKCKVHKGGVVKFEEFS